MAKEIYYAHEVKDRIGLIMLDEISCIVHKAAPAWENATPEEMINTIEGMFILAASIDENLKEEKE